MVLALLTVALAALWGAGGAALLRQQERQQAAALAAAATVTAARFTDAESLLRREAALLAQDPLVVQGVRRGDWATLARGGGRLRSLTLDRLADLVVILDAAGAPVVQVPASVRLPPLALPASPSPGGVVTLATVGGQPYLLGLAAVGGGPTGASPDGLVVIGRAIERLVATEPTSPAIVLVEGDRLRAAASATPLPAEGWAAATAERVVVLAGEPWAVRPIGRVQDAAVWAVLPQMGLRAERQRLAWTLLGSFAVAMAAVALAASAGRRRGLSLAVPAAALDPDIERRNRELEALYAAAVTMASSPDMETTAEQTLDVVLAVARVDTGMVYRLDAKRCHLLLVASRGVPAERVEGLRRQAVDATALGEAARSGQVTLVSAGAGGGPPEPTAVGGATQLVLPIPVQGETWGVMALAFTEPRVVDGDELTLLQAIAHQLGLAVTHSSLFAETQAKSRRLETLTRMAQTLAATLSTDEVMQRVAAAARELFDASVARLWLLDEDGEHLSLRGVAGPEPPADDLRHMRLGEGLVGIIAATRTALTIGDVADDTHTEHTARLRAEGLVSFAGVPLLVGDRLLGALAIAVRERHQYTDEEVGVLRSLGNQAAIALDNARHFAEEHTRHAYLAALLEINKKIGAMASMETLLGSIADEAARLLALDNAGFRLVEGDELVVAGLAGNASQTMLRTRIKFGESFSGQVIAARRTIVASIDTLTGLVPEHVAADRRLGYTTYLGVPLTVGERIIGVFAFRGRRPFSARDQELAEAFAGQAAIAIEHLRLFDEATRQAARMRALAEVGRLFSDNLDPAAVAQRIAESVRTLLGALSSVLYRLDPITRDLTAIAVAGEVGEGEPDDVVLRRGDGVAGLAILERRPAVSADVLTDARITMHPALRERVERGPHRAVLAVPLVVREQIIGALAVGDRTGRVFEPEEIRLAQAFADQAGLVLASAQLYADATRRRHEAEELARLAQRLTESLDVSDVVERTVESVLPLFAAQSSVLRLLQSDGSLVALAVGGRAREAFDPGHILPGGTGVLGLAAAEGRIVWSIDVASDRVVVVSDDLRELMSAATDGSVLAVPLRAKGLVVGALGIADRPGRVFSEQEGALLQAFADQATLALENARLFSMERARRRQIAALAEIERELAAELDSERLLHLIVERVASLFAADGALYTVDEDGTLVARTGTGTAAVPHERLAPGQGFVGACAAQRRGLLVNDYPHSPHALAPWVAAGLRHTMAQPLVLRDRLLGVIAIYRAGEDARPLLEEDLSLLESFTAQAAIAIENARLYAAADVRAARLRTLAHLNHLVSSSLDTDEVLTGIAHAAAEIMAAPFVAFWVADEAARTLQMRAFSTDVPDEPPITRLAFGEGAVGSVASERRPLNLTDIFVDGLFVGPEWARARGFTSMFAAPIVHQESLLGVLVLLAARPFNFGADDADLLRSFSEQAAAAIRNARLYEEARTYAERLRALEEVNRLVSSSLNTQEVLENLVRAIAQFFDAPYASVWAYDPVTRRLRRALTYGDAELAREVRDDLALGEGAVGWVAAHRQPILWTDVQADDRFIDAQQMLSHGLRWITAYPIAIGDRLLGAFCVNRAASSPVTPETASLMGSLAAQAGVALENARLYSETSRRLAETRTLLEVAEILSSTLDSRQLLKRVAVKVAQVCRVDRCSIELWDGDRVMPLMSQFADGRRAPELWESFMTLQPWAPRDVPAQARAAETRRPVIIDDTAGTDLIPREWVQAYGLKSYMVVPLIRHDQVIGVMNLDHCDVATPFQDWQQDLALAVAGQLALSLENTRLYAEAQERLRETTTLLRVGRVLSEPDAGDDLMRRVAAEVGRAFGSDMVGAYLLDARRERLHPVGGYHVPKELLEMFARRSIVIAGLPAVLPSWRAGRATWSADALNDERFADEWRAGMPPHSVLFAPTLAHGEPVGALFLVWWRTGRAFDPAEARLLEGVAGQVGLAMENAALSRQTQMKLAETETLLSASRALSSTLDLQGLVRHFLKTVATTVGADCVGSWLLDEDGEWLEPLAGYRIPPERLELFRTFRVSTIKDPFYAEAARRKKPVFTSDAMTDSRLPAHLLDGAPHRSQLFVPVIAKDRMIAGFAAVWWERAREFSESELALMEAIANQAGVALENARLFEENRRRVEELSVLHDMSREVTGQLDRTALLEAIRRQVARVLDVSNLVIALCERDGDDLHIAMRNLRGVPDMRQPLTQPLPAVGLMSVVLAQGRPVRTDDYEAECARLGVSPNPLSAGLRHWMGVPLTAGDQILGVIVLRSVARRFRETDERLLMNIAHLAALALSSARLFEDRTRAYGELAAAQDQLVRTEKLRALGEMASGVAHDFNNLLASVLGRAQLLLRRVQEPQQRQWLQVIERSALDGAQTVKRLQEFTRIRRDEPLVPLDLNQVVRDALEITQSRWREEPLSRGIAIELRTAFGALPPVAGDAAELREAMTNLILNAVDAMPQGGALTLTTAEVDDGIEVTVADTGVGIPAGVRDKIFDPFFTTKGPQGTGLGLSMTYGIISRHGASITVDSEEGRGSVFRLVFQRTTAAVAAAAAAVPPAPERAHAMRPLRCLVVDDELPVRTVLGDILESAGHTAVVLGDGAEAIERFRAEPFDLVLTDLAMPRVSGWQVARAVKEMAPDVPVFLVTGFGVELTSEERRTHGVDLVLVKPLQMQVILDAVAGAARLRPPSGPPEGC